MGNDERNRRDFTVRIPCIPEPYDSSRDGFPLKIAILEHGHARKRKVGQACEKRDLLNPYLWAHAPSSRVYAGVSYIGDKDTRLEYDSLTLDFCLRMRTIPERFRSLWSKEDTEYTARRTGQPVDTIAEIVEKGVYSSKEARASLPLAFYEFFTERVVTLFLFEALNNLNKQTVNYCDEVSIEKNAIVKYAGTPRETDMVIAVYKNSAFRNLLSTAQRLTPELHAELSRELENGS